MGSCSHEQPGPEEFARLLELGYAPVIHSVFAAAVELKVFDIIAQSDSGPDANYLSAFEIAAKLPKQTQDTPHVLDRMLQLLTAQSILDCRLIVNDKDGEEGCRKYGLNSLSKFLAPDLNGLSLAPPVIWCNAIRESCYSLKDAVLEGGIPFDKAHGMNLFEMMGTNPILNEIFNNAMRSKASFIMKEILRVYQGFGSLKNVVDVGGGLGSTIQSIVSKYPHIQGINFDLPHVIKNAPAYPGVEHVEGDMFLQVPTGDAIILKYILHDWSDEASVKLLKNCLKALPAEGGKVILVELILPAVTTTASTDVVSRSVYTADILMHVMTAGGKERSLKQYEKLANEAGFKSLKLVSRAYQYGVIEIYNY